MVLAADGAGHQLEELVLQRDHPAFFVSMLTDEPGEMIDIDDQQQVRDRQVVAQMPGSPLDVRLVAEGAVEQVIHELAADAVFGLGHLAELDHFKRDHGGRVLDGHHGQLLLVLRVLDDR